MNEHTWKVGDHLEIRAGDRIITGYDGKRTAGPALLEPFIVEEILRLAEREQDLLRQWATHRASLRDIMGLPVEAIDPVSVLAAVEALAEENASLKATVDPLVAGIATLEAQLAEVREEALRLDRENERLKEALPVFTANSPADQEKARILTEIFKVAVMHGDPVASLLQRIAALEAENTGLADECVKLARERDALGEELETAHEAQVEETGDKLRLADQVAVLEAEVESLRNANRLLARGSMHAALARSAEVSMAEVMRSDGGRRQLALEAEVERLKGENATLKTAVEETSEREERKADLATFFTYVEQANRILALEADNERLRAESATSKAKLDAIRGAATAATHDCSLRQEVFFLLSAPNEGWPVLPGEA